MEDPDDRDGTLGRRDRLLGFFREGAHLLQAPDADRSAADALATAAERFGISYLS